MEYDWNIILTSSKPPEQPLNRLWQAINDPTSDTQLENQNKNKHKLRHNNLYAKQRKNNIFKSNVIDSSQ